MVPTFVDGCIESSVRKGGALVQIGDADLVTMGLPSVLSVLEERCTRGKVRPQGIDYIGEDSLKRVIWRVRVRVGVLR